MQRREFLKKAGISFGGIPFWMGILPEHVAAKIPTGVKITDVKTFIVGHYVFVKIYTNKGVTGIGEASITNGGLERAVQGGVLDRADILIGRNPTDIEFLWQALYRWPRSRGGTVDVSAISGLDIALWDILGKLLDTPIYQLMGGKARTRSCLYVQTSGNTPEQAKERLQPILDGKFRAIRIGLTGGISRVFNRPHNLKGAVANCEMFRELVGDRIDIIVDAHGILTTNMALDYAKAVEPYDILFLEDPVVQENLSGLKYIQEHTSTPLHIGESNSTKFGHFREIIFRRLASGVRPDVGHAGGLTESKKICTMAEANFMDVSMHAGPSPVANFAATHLALTVPNCIVQESHPPLRKKSSWSWLLEVFNGDDIVIEDGYALPPEKPGLGCDLNEKVAAKYPHIIGQTQPYTVFDDGSVGDW